MLYRTFESKDLAGIVSAWNVSLWCDPITEKRVKNLILCDPNFDSEGCIVAVDNDTIIGFLYAIRRRVPMFGNLLEPESGWIHSFFVDKTYQRRGVGTELLRRGMDFLKTCGVKTMYFSPYAPNYIVPGIDSTAYPAGEKLLVARGFSIQYEAVAMDCCLVNYQYPLDVQELKKQRELEGYTFTPLETGEIPEVAWFAHSKFNEDWGRAIRQGLSNNVDKEQVTVAKNSTGDTIGFTMFGAYEGIRERFGPFGVDEACRGLGIGKILLHECLWKQKQVGLHNSWFLWTGEESAAGYLYRKYGFTITRRFKVMKRELI